MRDLLDAALQVFAEQGAEHDGCAMTARAVMVLGCTSDAGKSWIATALCRWYARQGLVVRPFKAQNMSNHARVVGTSGRRRRR